MNGSKIQNLKNQPWEHPQAHLKGGRLCDEQCVVDFRTILEEAGLFDLGFFGQWFTWERGKFPHNNIRERLDKGVAQLAWRDLFMKYKLTHCVHSIFDHFPLLLDTNLVNMNQRGNRTFQFGEAWLLEDSCEAEEHLHSLLTADSTDDALDEMVLTRMHLNFEIDKAESLNYKH
ncbi:hypothetical protein GOBAR_DD03964 [Gossypium barbadense]|nr:hypothetical protein GOBAR_DD03964 [Gossypium barbadense]